MGKTTAELQTPTGYVDDFWDFGTSSEYPALKADFDGDGIATWEEFGDQRGQSPMRTG